MKNAYQEHQTAHIKTILDSLPRNTDATLREFTRQFYARVLVEDLERLNAQQALAIAESAFHFIEKRLSQEPKIRIFKPEKKTHGYEGRYMVIELLNNDMPFLVDSLSAELLRQGITIRETIHPILHVVRNSKGQLESLGELDKESGRRESLIHFEVSTLPESVTPEKLMQDLEAILKYITASVEDWREIVAKATGNIQRIERVKSYFDKETVAEAEDFLQWLIARNFVFLGYAEYDFYDARGNEALIAVANSKLGILRVDDEAEKPSGLESLPPELRHFLLVPQLIEITKSNRKSPVHRPVPMDYIGIKRFDNNGKVIGEARFLGLFTSSVYYQSAENIPFARQKMDQVLKRSEFDPASHDGKSLKAIIEFLPRDEIFQMSPDDLFAVSMGILALEARPGVRAFVRKDAFERFVSLMIFVPREKFSTDLRHQIQTIAEKAFNGTVSSFSTQISEARLTRLHLIVKTTPGEIPQVDLSAFERDIAKSAYLWSDLLHEALAEKYEEAKAEEWQRVYANAFSQSYINSHDASGAAYDIKKIEEALASGGLVLDLFRNRNESDKFIHLKIYNPNEEIALSDILPMLENSGFRVMEEQPFQVSPEGVGQVWIRDFKLQLTSHIDGGIDAIKPLLEDAMLRVWRRDMENDGFNALILKAGLNWRQVVVLRAYAKYLKQIAFGSSPAAIAQAFNKHPMIVKNIAALFEARFDPREKNREAKAKKLVESIDKQLGDVSNAAEDRILRRYLEIIDATLRTNFYQSVGKDGAHKPVLSFKINSKAVPELPLPKPQVEIFVYGTRVEGVHLRGGKVARGGLRWSDRQDDFRTEILGLMKAQMVKNSVIVPVGSKGGFVLKRPPLTGGREAIQEEGIACYKLYLSGLLDITDNIVKGKVVPPADVVRHDEDDPYLVVAADKGTATFSDIANGVSADYGFWLGDAFASGGSAGYDHKAMAITARGGWVSVTRHFQEMGVDITRQDFTTVGVGDMAGDVFGNGMILSDRIKLVAAFNHMHIFIDPNPDVEAGFKERQRLFALPRSSWKDYNEKLISKGGGIFERSAKSIPLSKEAQTALGITKSSMAPDDLIRNILLAPVDLLWNGGIGTYVKAEEESHEQVGDRANNALRVNGRELRCKIVGEGGNLGFTQKGRIEYARNGGRINTDAIDNSAGVDCSDHEVNIKIALSHEVSSGKFSMQKRDKFLESMTDNVAYLVLKDNILQTQIITIVEQLGVRMIDPMGRLMHMLEREGLLDRAIEFLPTDKDLAALKAANKGFTRPEISVLLAYSKMSLYKHLVESSLPDEPYFLADLKRYFPQAMREQFAAAIERHPLRREIIATVMTNSLVNRAGITFYSRVSEDLDIPARDIAASYALTRDAFALRGLWKGIEELGSEVNIATKVDMYVLVHRFLERVAEWFLRSLPLPLDIDAVAREINPAIAEINKQKDALYTDVTRQEATMLVEQLTQQAVSRKLAESIADLSIMVAAPDIIAIANKHHLSVMTVGKAYFAIGEKLNLSWLERCANGIVATSYWDRLAAQSLLNDLYDEQRWLTGNALIYKGGIDSWFTDNEEQLARLSRFIEDLKSGGNADLAKLTVALKHLRAVGSKK